MKKEFLGFYFNKLGEAYNKRGLKLKYAFIGNSQTILVKKKRYKVPKILADLFIPNPKNYLKKPSDGWSPWSPDASKSNLMKKHTAKIFDKVPSLLHKKSFASTNESSGGDSSDNSSPPH